MREAIDYSQCASRIESAAMDMDEATTLASIAISMTRIADSMDDIKNVLEINGERLASIEMNIRPGR